MSPRKTIKSKPAKKLLPMFLKPKPIKLVTKAVLEKIADSIYNPKTKSYLNLCSGTLQNGPDPACETRSMHCGLGELYYVITGNQPEDESSSEIDVIDEIVSRSTLSELENIRWEAKKKIEKLGLPKALTEGLLAEVDGSDFHFQIEDDFRNALGQIPNINDIGKENEPDFKARAIRVAKQIRLAAASLHR